MYKFIRKIILIAFCLLLLVPNNAKAAKILDAKIGGLDTVKVGGPITVPFYIDLSGVSMTDVNSYGVLAVAFDLIFDDEILSVTGIKSDGFTSEIYSENHEYGILSIVDVNSTKNKCVDGILYCGTYEVDVTFYAADTTETSTTIKMGDVLVSGYQLQDGDFDIDDDTIDIEDTLNKSKTIKITKGATTTTETPKSVVKSGSADIDTTKIINNIETKKEETPTDSSKDNNCYLKDLRIDGYLLEFYKRTYEYDLEVEENVNNLVIDATLDSEKALLEIVGADNLAKNNNKVLIKVKAEDGTTKTYTINVKKGITKKQTKLTSTMLLDKVKNIFSEYKLYFIIGGCVIAVIIIIAVIINKINDNKLGKNFDNM